MSPGHIAFSLLEVGSATLAWLDGFTTNWLRGYFLASRSSPQSVDSDPSSFSSWKDLVLASLQRGQIIVGRPNTFTLGEEEKKMEFKAS